MYIIYCVDNHKSVVPPILNVRERCNAGKNAYSQRAVEKLLYWAKVVIHVFIVVVLKFGSRFSYLSPKSDGVKYYLRQVSRCS